MFIALDTLHRISNVFQRFNSHSFHAFIFGSQALGTAKSNSDIDIGIESADSIPASLFFDIQEALDTNISQSIDLVDFSRVPEDFKKIAKKTIISLL